MEVKVGDVFSFEYNDEIVENVGHSRLYHCFDGQLIAKEINGVIFLVDTYWVGGDNRTLTVKEALEKGELVFKCNINEVENINKYEMGYYADEDVFNLSYQHWNYKSYAKRIGAKKSAEKMIAVLKEKRHEKSSAIESASIEIERIDECIAKLNSGEVDGIYI